MVLFIPIHHKRNTSGCLNYILIPFLGRYRLDSAKILLVNNNITANNTKNGFIRFVKNFIHSNVHVPMLQGLGKTTNPVTRPWIHPTTCQSLPSPGKASRSSLVSGGNRRSRTSIRNHTTHRSVVTMASAPDNTGKSLLIVGPGVLGSCLGKMWIDEHGTGTVVGQTKTTSNHDKLHAIGIEPRTAEGMQSGETFPNVAYCAPPSGSEDYPGDVAKALACWDGTGNFIFTSSAGVYNINDGSACDEASPVYELGSNPRTDALLKAENACVDKGGNVVRLVGLYHRTRGPHTFFLKQGEVARWGGYVVNMIHYEDAASLCLAVLMGRGSKTGVYRSNVFVGCDDAPVTFQDMMTSIETSGVLPGKVVFTEKESGANLGKVMSNARTREQLGWLPKYKTVCSFFENGGEDWYSSNEFNTLGSPHA